ncbi:MAG: hypothetical protein N5P05_002712 [Chroococcopsis gigantea SAG 12.99]|jgi:RNA ligase|nr:hypothetical protein [Chroococcopsis gigantea SAG 12.99]
MKHPAVSIGFDELYAKLQEEVNARRVLETRSDELSLYLYTNQTVYNKEWNEWNKLARGLLLDLDAREVRALSFPKFFNYGEAPIGEIPNCNFKIYDKVDGSLGICFHHKQEWRVVTKGSFTSMQAIWGTRAVREIVKEKPGALVPGTTYLFEMIHPGDRKVVNYDFEGLVLLGAYEAGGAELDYDALNNLVVALDHPSLRLVRMFPPLPLGQLLQISEKLDASVEGFVVRFDNGYRLKIKGAEYCRLHRYISGVTPLGVWRVMRDNNVEETRRKIPEEYWSDFDKIHSILSQQLQALLERVEDYYLAHTDRTDKELGLMLSELPELAVAYLFARRRDPQWYERKKCRDGLMLRIRPTQNRMEGYEPSARLNSLLEDE